MKPFEEKKFVIPELVGISADSVAEHLKLYAGYVKNAKLIEEKMGELLQDKEKNAYLIGELMRRFSFEYNGIRNHELYFSCLEGGSTALTAGSALHSAIEKTFGNVEGLIQHLSMIAMTRGIGWSMLWYDRKQEMFLATWIDEQHLGQLQDCTPILGIDMWEHAYVADYKPSGKKQYIEDFFKNLNWSVVEKNFENATK